MLCNQYCELHFWINELAQRHQGGCLLGFCLSSSKGSKLVGQAGLVY
jgi:hypothetical protein